MAHLQDQLDQITENTRTLVQPDRLAVIDRAVEELFASGIEERILPVGAKAPEFELPDAAGKMVRSEDLLALGPLVISFFRGRWCPYCVTELEAWRDLYPVVREWGGLVIGISPQTQRQSDFTAGHHKIPYALLTDEACETGGEVGLGGCLAARAVGWGAGRGGLPAACRGRRGGVRGGAEGRPGRRSPPHARGPA